MKTVFVAVLLSFYHQGQGMDTIWTSTRDDCERIVAQWKEQPPRDVNALLPDMHFDGYCRPMEVSIGFQELRPVTPGN